MKRYNPLTASQHSQHHYDTTLNQPTSMCVMSSTWRALMAR